MTDEKYNEPIEQEISATDAMVKREIVPYLKDISFVLCVVVILFMLLFRIAIVEGSSMYDTLVDGDVVLLLNSAIAGDPKPGDIIVASKQSYADGTPIIKRVIATQGQTVDINFSTGEVFVDGVLLDEPYIYSPTTYPEGVQFPLVVDEGCLFVLGDNRGVSKDSRSPAIGLIDCRQVSGKAIFIIFAGKDPNTEGRDFSRIGLVK